MWIEEMSIASSEPNQMLAITKWMPFSKEIKGVVQIVHGMEEHIKRYGEFAQILTKQGFVVIGHDHLGHGNTAKTKEDMGYFSRKNGWDRLTQDVHLVYENMRQAYPFSPYYILGHSMGSLVVRTYLTQYQDCLTGVILSGTSGQKRGLLLGQLLCKSIILVKGQRYRSKLLEFFVTDSFNRKVRPTKTKADWINRDQREVAIYLQDEKCGIPFTAKAYQDLMQGSYYLSKQKNTNQTQQVPILLISGDEDPVGGTHARGVIRVYHMLEKAGIKDITIRLWKGARHELLREMNKSEVYQVILEWMNKRGNINGK